MNKIRKAVAAVTPKKFATMADVRRYHREHGIKTSYFTILKVV